MGNLIKWKSIDSEATYDYARIYRATSQAGSYTLLASQSITDQSYYDPTGTTSSWYKVDFYDSTNLTASSLSSAIKGGTYTAYCTAQDVRDICNITTNDLTDTQLTILIENAGKQLNSDINQAYEEEVIEYINNTKDNEVDGSNTTFYTKNYPLGDLNDDMTVDTSDIHVYSYASDGTRTELTVSTITPNEGKFVLSTAPETTVNKLTTTYCKSSKSVSDPSPLIKTACTLLATAWAYSKINVGKSPKWKMGSTSIWRDMNSFKTFYDKYLQVLSQINNENLVDIRAPTDTL